MADKESSGHGKPGHFKPLHKDTDASEDWQRELVNRLAFASLNEQRRTRRWNVFFKFLLALYLGAILLLYWPADWATLEKKGDKHTALVELKGIISDQTEANADTIVEGLREAFKDKKTAGVILRLNTPGGSPVQSSYIYNEIRRLREKYPDTPLYAVVTDLCASGGYFVASAADKIYVDKSSIVGSIGVIMGSFGFVEGMEKIGIERRLYTAGDNKDFLDPFSPARASDVEHAQTLLDGIHNHFITAVKEGRGERLKDDTQLYSGLVWTGEEGIELGLVDAIGSAGEVARDVIGAEDIVDYTPEPDLLERLSERLGMAVAKGLNQLLASGAVRLR